MNSLSGLTISKGENRGSGEFPDQRLVEGLGPTCFPLQGSIFIWIEVYLIKKDYCMKDGNTYRSRAWTSAITINGSREDGRYDFHWVSLTILLIE
jgi:hypothetical protein